jgi:hypothetical protein
MGSLGALANIMGRRGLTVYISVLFHVLITPIFINIAHHKPSEFAVAMPIQAALSAIYWFKKECHQSGGKSFTP